MTEEIHPVLAFVDCETTGANPKENSIFQFSMKVFNGNRTISAFKHFAAPFENDPLDPTLIAFNQYDPEEIKKYPPQEDFVNHLVEELNRLVDPYNKEDKLFLVAYSAVFDYDFLRSTFTRIGSRYFGSYFWYPPICAMQLSAAFFMNVRHKLNNFKLPYVYEMVTGRKANPDKLHNSDYDLGLLIGLYKALDPEYFRYDPFYNNNQEKDIPF